MLFDPFRQYKDVNTCKQAGSLAEAETETRTISRNCSQSISTNRENSGDMNKNGEMQREYFEADINYAETI